MWPANNSAERCPWDCTFDASQFMACARFEDIKQHLAVVHVGRADKSDPWWSVRPFVGDFNANRRTNVHAGWAVCIDESIIAFFGPDLPHTTVMPDKPESVGCLAKTLCDGGTGVMLHIELQEGKEAMSLKVGWSNQSVVLCA